MNQERGDQDQRAAGGVRARTLVTRNTVWNVLGTGLPLLVALVTFRILIHGIGTERFGVLAIAWVILGYFGLFDLGLGRATTKFLSEAFEHGRILEARTLLWTSLSMNLILGVIGGLVLATLSPILVSDVLNIEPRLQAESLSAFYLMAATVPLVTLSTAIRGVLEARHSFGLLNAVQVPTSTLTYLAPLLVLPFSTSLAWLVAALAASRLLGMAAFLVAVLWVLEDPFAGPFFARKKLGELLSFGGWLTVTNIVSPLMVYADRFVIGSLASMTAVTYYATPYEAVTRLWILPQSLTRTIFPIFSAKIGAEREARLYESAIKYLALILAPVLATTVCFAPDLLYLWLGGTFARNSTLVLQVLATGILVNSLAHVPFTLIQGRGRPDVTAKFHLLELPFYLLLLWYGVQTWGIAGAAVAWTARVSVDGVLLGLYARRAYRAGAAATEVRLPQTLALATLLVACGWLLSTVVEDITIKLAIWSLLLVPAIWQMWTRLLTSDERERFFKTTEGRVPGKHVASEDGRKGL